MVVIAGPTAIGKTEVAIEIAKAFNTEILSADSRQFYKEMEIGTSKPSPKQLMAVKHHFINSLTMTENYNAGQFEEDVLKKLEELFKTKDMVVMAGGSGLYIDAVCNGFDPIPKSDDLIRKQLMSDLETKGLKVLQEELREVDPVFYKEVDLANSHRVIRGLEVYRTTGRPFSSFRNRNQKQRPFKIVKIGLEAEREVIYARINERVDRMIAWGLEEEVKSLLQYKETNALNSVGYWEWFNYFEGTRRLEWVIELIKQNTRRYAKRQMTWFRGDATIKWF